MINKLIELSELPAVKLLLKLLSTRYSDIEMDCILGCITKPCKVDSEKALVEFDDKILFKYPVNAPLEGEDGVDWSVYIEKAGDYFVPNEELKALLLSLNGIELDIDMVKFGIGDSALGYDIKILTNAREDEFSEFDNYTLISNTSGKNGFVRVFPTAKEDEYEVFNKIMGVKIGTIKISDYEKMVELKNESIKEWKSKAVERVAVTELPSE